ncbi:thioredoxin family protein, partial [Pseudomonadales bacterium]|nr:thioredoxin family protein [Pseudomonadales bacterium]
MRISARGYCIPICVGFIALFSFTSSHSAAQTRDEMVREDRKKIMEEGFWIYNDLPKAFTKAKQSGKPLLVVLRCIPCHECVKLDDELVDQDPVIRPLLDEFVCARQVSTNGLDLELFQYDTDQSFAVFI